MVNWSSLLLNVGIDVPSEREQFNISCPFHVDQLPSCSINVEVGKWICFAGCGQGSLVTFLAKYTSKDITEIEQDIANNAVEQAMLADDVVSGAEMKDLRTFTLKDSAGTTLFTMFGAGDAT